MPEDNQNSPVPINIDEVMEIMDNDQELLIECFDDFVEGVSDYIANIKEAIDSNNEKNLNEAAHKMKGTLRYLGAIHASEIALKLEKMGKDNDLSESSATLQKLEFECKRIIDFVAEYKKSNPL